MMETKPLEGKRFKPDVSDGRKTIQLIYFHRLKLPTIRLANEGRQYLFFTGFSNFFQTIIHYQIMRWEAAVQNGYGSVIHTAAAYPGRIAIFFTKKEKICRNAQRRS
ncbi:MAG: hypothetical protein E7464_07170 [Ruminococcaceae bacterium]|nr:hypothetical protein [Oscillospiraceae bacterium]